MKKILLISVFFILLISCAEHKIDKTNDIIIHIESIQEFSIDIIINNKHTKFTGKSYLRYYPEDKLKYVSIVGNGDNEIRLCIKNIKHKYIYNKYDKDISFQMNFER